MIFKLMRRFGWTASLAVCAALIGAGCDDGPGDLDDDDENEVIEEIEPSPVTVPSTDPYSDVPPSEVEPSDLLPEPRTTDDTRPDETPITTGTERDTATPESNDDSQPQPEVSDEPGNDEEPQGNDTNS
ncbi:hypothetical protein [Tautonia rosea]|uniref:hypothetical protein n=1 Tax=Tautonia rosea TaxID=2728037 RepID=UPI001474A458|nr:hypothetical protein [Tautonia rosea]